MDSEELKYGKLIIDGKSYNVEIIHQSEAIKDNITPYLGCKLGTVTETTFICVSKEKNFAKENKK